MAWVWSECLLVNTIINTVFTWCISVRQLQSTSTVLFFVLSCWHCCECRQASWRDNSVLWMSSQEWGLHLRRGTGKVPGRGSSDEAVCCILTWPDTKGLCAAFTGAEWRRGVENLGQRWTYLCLRVSTVTCLMSLEFDRYCKTRIFRMSFISHILQPWWFHKKNWSWIFKISCCLYSII